MSCSECSLFVVVDVNFGKCSTQPQSNPKVAQMNDGHLEYTDILNIKLP